MLHCVPFPAPGPPSTNKTLGNVEAPFDKLDVPDIRVLSSKLNAACKVSIDVTFYLCPKTLKKKERTT